MRQGRWYGKILLREVGLLFEVRKFKHLCAEKDANTDDLITVCKCPNIQLNVIVKSRLEFGSISKRFHMNFSQNPQS